MRPIGVDVGGTFTDLIYADTEAGQTGVHRISTTPDDPSRGDPLQPTITVVTDAEMHAELKRISLFRSSARAG
jgi:N-methylhydantoinase A/oxoprolinase/acetone carboxylase beta subunit